MDIKINSYLGNQTVAFVKIAHQARIQAKEQQAKEQTQPASQNNQSNQTSSQTSTIQPKK